MNTTAIAVRHVFGVCFHDLPLKQGHLLFSDGIYDVSVDLCTVYLNYYKQSILWDRYGTIDCFRSLL